MRQQTRRLGYPTLRPAAVPAGLFSTAPARLLRVAPAVVAAFAVSAISPIPAIAGPRPAPSEWWFGPWAISDVWKTTTGRGVTVAVLDSGTNPKVPELAGVVVPGGDATGHGTDGRTDFDKEKDGHGTAMSVLIAGQGGGRSGYVGVAPGVKIMPVLSTDVSPHLDSIAVMSRGIRFATDHGATVINMSIAADGNNYPNSCPEPVQEAVAYAIEHGAVVVAATGDEGDTTNNPEFPAACGGVLAVGAVDKYSNPWKGTQAQDYVSVAAPGVNVGWAGRSGTFYPDSWGSSSSSALTSGAVALIRAANPDMGPREVVQRVVATAKDTGEPGRDDTTGFGIVRIYRAMHKAEYPVPVDAPNPSFDRLDAWRAQHGGAPSTVRPSVDPSAAATPTGTSAAAVSDGGSGTGWVVASGLAVVAFVLAVVWAGLALRARVRRQASGSTDAGFPPAPSA